MRRRTRASLLGAVALAAGGALGGAAPAPAHPGHAFPIVSVSLYSFSPSPVTVFEGDIVFWEFDGPDTNHSITADDGSFDSASDVPKGQESKIDNKQGSQYPFVFDHAGTYAYHCRVHSNMHGTVVVQPAAAGGGGGTGGGATVAAVSGLSAKPSAKTHLLTVRFTLSAASKVKITLRRSGHAKVVRTKSVSASGGRAKATVSLRHLAAGSYRVTATPSGGTAAGTTVHVRT